MSIHKRTTEVTLNLDPEWYKVASSLSTVLGFETFEDYVSNCIETLEVEWFKDHFREQNYTGHQLDKISELKIKNYNNKCYPSTYQSRTINELLDKVGKD